MYVVWVEPGKIFSVTVNRADTTRKLRQIKRVIERCRLIRNAWTMWADDGQLLIIQVELKNTTQDEAALTTALESVVRAVTRERVEVTYLYAEGSHQELSFLAWRLRGASRP